MLDFDELANDPEKRHEMAEFQLARSDRLYQIECWAWQNWADSGDRADLRDATMVLGERARAAGLFAMCLVALEPNRN